VTLANSRDELALLIPNEDSIRADNGNSIALSLLTSVGSHTTINDTTGFVLTGKNLTLGSDVTLLGGFSGLATLIGDNVTIGNGSVVSSSSIGSGSTIGFRALVIGSQLTPGTVVPDRAIIINNVTVGSVQW
jgi:carbonic anhydrase/acetyltransferase-like protein (isoleucine patch superfamily)